MDVLLVLSLSLNLLFVAGVVFVFLMPPDWVIQRFRGLLPARRRSFFHCFAVEPGDVVFLGDSITAGAEWSELFPDAPVKNRGIGADTTGDVLARIGQVTAGHPAKVFLLIGTNDLWERRTDRHILHNLDRILTEIAHHSPETKVVLQGIMPRQARYAARIRGLNHALAALAARHEVAFVDLYPHFAGPDGAIRGEFSNDKLHLMGAGYRRWQKVIAPHVRE